MSNTENSGTDNEGLSDSQLGVELLNNQIEKEAIKAGVLEDPNKKNEVKELNEVEKEQADKGWKPKADFIEAGGNEDDWIPAKQFKRVGEIIVAKQQASKQANTANSEVKELTKTVQTLIDKHRKAELKIQEERLEELRQLKMQKIREGDAPAVLAAEAEAEQVLKAKTALLDPPKQAPLEDPTVKEWEANNTWLREDSLDENEQIIREAMRAMVGKRAQFYMETDPNIDPTIALKDIDNRLRKAFPQKFGVIKEEKIAKVSSSDNNSIKPKTDLFKSLNYAQQKMFHQMSKIPGSYTLDEYVDLLKKAGEL